MAGQEVARGEIVIELDDRAAMAALHRVDHEFDRTMRDIDRQEADVTIKTDLTRLKKDLKQANDEFTKAMKAREAAETASEKRSTAQKLRHARERFRAVAKETEGVVQLAAAREKESKALELTDRRLAAVTRREVARERIIAQAERRALAAAREQERAQARVNREEEHGARVRAKEIDEIPRLQRQYAMLSNQLEKLARVKQKAGKDKVAVFHVELQEREVLERFRKIERTLAQRNATIKIPVEPDIGRRAGENLRIHLLRNNTLLGLATAVGADIGVHMGRGIGGGLRRTLDRGLGNTLRGVGQGAAAGALGGVTKLMGVFGRLSEMTVRLGPFTATIRQLFVAMSLFAPIILDVVGALGSLVGLAGSAALGLGALGVAVIGGLIPAFAGMFAVLKPVVGEFSAAMKASKAAHDAILKYGKGSDQAKAAQEKLNNTLSGLDERTRSNIKNAGSLSAKWKELTAPARQQAFATIAEGLGFASRNVGTFAARTNEGMTAVGTGLRSIIRNLDTASLDTIMRGFNASLQPALAGLGNMLNYLLKVGAAAAHHLRPMAQVFERWSAGLLDTTRNAGRFQSKIDGVVESTKTLGRFLMAAGRFSKAFFGGGVDGGERLADTMSNALNRWTLFLNTAQGQQKLGQFFDEAVDGAQALYATLGPIVTSFVRWSASIAPFARAFFDGAAAVSQAVGELLRLTGLRTPLAALATTLGVLWGVSKIRAAATAVGHFSRALVGLTAAQSVAGAAGAAAARGGPGAFLGSTVVATNAAKTAGAVSNASRSATVARTAFSLLGAATIGIAAPMAGVGVAATAAGVGLYLLMRRTAAYIETEKQAQEATRNYQGLLRGLPGANVALAQSTLDVASATEQVNSLEKDAQRLRKAGKGNTNEYRNTMLQLRQARLQEATAQENQISLSKQEEAAQRKLVSSARDSAIKRQQQVDEMLSDPTKIKSAQQFRDAVDAMTRAEARYQSALEQASLQTINHQRALRGVAPIAQTAARALGEVARLGSRSLSQKIGIKFEDPGAASRVAKSAAAALRAGVPTRVVTKIVADSKNAEDAIRRIRRERIEAKNVPIKAQDRTRGTIAGVIAALLGIPNPTAHIKGNSSPLTRTVAGAVGMLASIVGPHIPIQGNKNPLLAVIASIPRILAPIIQPIVGRRTGGKAQGGVEPPGMKRIPFDETDRAYQRAQGAGTSMTHGGRYSRPTLLVGEEDRSEYVIATNPAYRRQNIAYLQAAARDLGLDFVEAAAGGKKAAKKARKRGASGAAKTQKQRTPTTRLESYIGPVELDDLQTLTDNAKDAYKEQRDKVDDWHKMKAKDRKGHKKPSVAAMNERLGAYNYLKGQLKRAQEAKQDFTNLETRIDTLASAMSEADMTGSANFEGHIYGYSALRSLRGGLLGRRQDLLTSAFASLPQSGPATKTKWATAVAAAIGSGRVDIAENERQRTPAEQAMIDAVNESVATFGIATGAGTLGGIDRRIAESQMNDVGDNAATIYVNEAVESMRDNLAPLTERANFWTDTYNRLVGMGAPDSAITNAANEVTSSRSAISSLQESLSTAPTTTREEQYRLFSNARQDLYSQMGSNFSPLWGTTGAMGGNAVGDNVVTKSVTINNSFPTPPPDPHLWSQGVAFEMANAV